MLAAFQEIILGAVRKYNPTLGRERAKEEAEFALLEVVTAYPANKDQYLFREVRERVKRIMGKNVAPELETSEELDLDHVGELPAQEAALSLAERIEERVAPLRAKYDGALAADLIDEPTHRLLVLHHCDGLTMRETAAAVDRAYEAVKKQLLRGRKRVEGKVNQRPHGPKPRA